MMKKKFLSVALSACLTLFMLPSMAFADVEPDASASSDAASAGAPAQEGGSASDAVLPGSDLATEGDSIVADDVDSNVEADAPAGASQSDSSDQPLRGAEDANLESQSTTEGDYQAEIIPAYCPVSIQSNNDSAFTVEYTDAIEGNSGMKAARGSMIILKPNYGYSFASAPTTNTGDPVSAMALGYCIVVGFHSENLVVTVDVEPVITSIWGLPSQIAVGVPVSLTELVSVSPSDAPKNMTWKLIDGGDTGAVIEDAATGLLTTQNTGVITVAAYSTGVYLAQSSFVVFVVNDPVIGSQTPGDTSAEDAVDEEVVEEDQGADFNLAAAPIKASEPKKLLTVEREADRLAPTSDGMQAATLLSLGAVSLLAIAASALARKRME